MKITLVKKRGGNWHYVKAVDDFPPFDLSALAKSKILNSGFIGTKGCNLPPIDAARSTKRTKLSGQGRFLFLRHFIAVRQMSPAVVSRFTNAAVRAPSANRNRIVKLGAVSEVSSK